MTKKTLHRHSEKPGDSAATSRRSSPLSNGLFSTAVVATAATVGSLATDPKSTWYKDLEKPSWQPPPIAFPIAWTTLYAGIAIGVARGLNKLDDQGKSGRGLRWCLVRNMVLNAGWSVLFFQKKNLTAATAEAAMLAVSSASLARRTAQADRTAGIPLAAYAAWTVFATALTSKIRSLELEAAN